MKTASTLLQILALGACFTMQAYGTLVMPGTRRALQTMEAATGLQGNHVAASGRELSIFGL